MHNITWDGIQIDARHRRRWPLILTVGCMFLMVVWEGTGVPAGNWLTLGKAACEVNWGRAFCTGFPDSGLVSAGAPASCAIVLIKNMSRVNIQSVALAKGFDEDLACGPWVLLLSCCTVLLWREWLPWKFPLQIFAEKSLLWISRYDKNAWVNHFFS